MQLAELMEHRNRKHGRSRASAVHEANKRQRSMHAAHRQHCEHAINGCCTCSPNWQHARLRTASHSAKHMTSSTPQKPCNSCQWCCTQPASWSRIPTRLRYPDPARIRESYAYTCTGATPSCGALHLHPLQGGGRHTRPQPAQPTTVCNPPWTPPSEQQQHAQQRAGTTAAASSARSQQPQEHCCCCCC